MLAEANALDYAGMYQASPTERTNRQEMVQTPTFTMKRRLQLAINILCKSRCYFSEIYFIEILLIWKLGELRGVSTIL